MKLTDIARLDVPEPKVREYLLSLTHPDGGGKAKFFMLFGFTSARWQAFAGALVEHATLNEITSVKSSEYGQKYEIDGSLNSPDGRNPLVRTVWVVENEKAEARLVTAYPLHET